MLQFMETGRPGFGLRLEDGRDTDGIITEIAVDNSRQNAATVQFSLRPGIAASMHVEVSNDGLVVQDVQITNSTAHSESVKFVYDLGISVHRASYGQLTEGGPIPLPKSQNELAVSRNISIRNPYLNGHIECCLQLDGEEVGPSELLRTCDFGRVKVGEPLDISCPLTVDIGPGSSRSITAVFRLFPDIKPHEIWCEYARRDKEETWLRPDTVEAYIVRRNIDYILGLCSIPLETSLAVITDHVALPLGWNRDNL